MRENCNPWQVLSYQFIEKAILLFNRHSFSEAHKILKEAFENMIQVHDLFEKPTEYKKNTFHTAVCYFEAYKEWDNFNHKSACGLLKKIYEKKLNNLKEAFKNYEIDVEKDLKKAVDYLDKILQFSKSGKNSPYLIFDLIENAKRKNSQGKFDDAVARLYRAIEAMAQYRLEKNYETNSAKVPYSSLTPELKKRKADNGGPVSLALQDSYLFLKEKGDPLGEKFYDEKLNASCSPLTKRNLSILAHGFESLNQKDFKKLSKTTDDLFSVLQEDFKNSQDEFKNMTPVFPKFEE